MAEQSDNSPAPVAAPERAAFRWDRLLAWVPLAAILGLLVARAAVVAEGYFASFLFFPLMVGVILGGTIVLAADTYFLSNEAMASLLVQQAASSGLDTVLVSPTGVYKFTFSGSAPAGNFVSCWCHPCLPAES